MPLPNLIIAGVHLSGTTFLFRNFSDHPDVSCSSAKETLFFLPIRDGGQLAPVAEYERFFRHCSGKSQYVMEASPGYFHGGEPLAQAIKSLLGDVRIVICLRDPVDRLLSNYRFLKSQMILPRDASLADYVGNRQTIPQQSFRAVTDSYWAIHMGFYADYLPGWLKVFGDSLKVVFFDDLRQRPHQLLEELCDWLTISSDVFRSKRFTTEHKSTSYRSGILHGLALRTNARTIEFWNRHPKAKKRLIQLYHSSNGRAFEEAYSEAAIQELRSIYRPYNQRLAMQLAERGDKQLPSWLSSSLETR
jgi:hypothetical protein